LSGCSSIFTGVKYLNSHDLIGGVITRIQVVHVRKNPAGIGPRLNVISKNNFVVFAKRPLLGWFAPVLVESGGIVD